MSRPFHHIHKRKTKIKHSWNVSHYARCARACGVWFKAAFHLSQSALVPVKDNRIIDHRRSTLLRKSFLATIRKLTGGELIRYALLIPTA